MRFFGVFRPGTCRWRALRCIPGLARVPPGNAGAVANALSVEKMLVITDDAQDLARGSIACFQAPNALIPMLSQDLRTTVCMVDASQLLHARICLMELSLPGQLRHRTSHRVPWHEMERRSRKRMPIGLRNTGQSGATSNARCAVVEDLPSPATFANAFAPIRCKFFIRITGNSGAPVPAGHSCFYLFISLVFNKRNASYILGI